MTTERSPKMCQYTKEMNQAYRKEQEQKAAELKEENRERMEREAAPRVWLADRGRETDFQRESGRSFATRAAGAASWTPTVAPAKKCEPTARAASRKGRAMTQHEPSSKRSATRT
jgi:hypothetical protein